VDALIGSSVEAVVSCFLVVQVGGRSKEYCICGYHVCNNRGSDFVSF
jgi:hypothetical protein